MTIDRAGCARDAHPAEVMARQSESRIVQRIPRNRRCTSKA
jgi:hypothetical protein